MLFSLLYALPLHSLVYIRLLGIQLLGASSGQMKNCLRWYEQFKRDNISQHLIVLSSILSPLVFGKEHICREGWGFFLFFNLLYFNLQYCIGFATHWHESTTGVFVSWIPLPPPSSYHPSGSSQCTSPKHPVSCIEPRLAIYFLYDSKHVSMPFSQIIPLSPSPTGSKRLFYTPVSLFYLSYRVIITIFLNSIYMC